jgi:hypothetical protein
VHPKFLIDQTMGVLKGFSCTRPAPAPQAAWMTTKEHYKHY